MGLECTNKRTLSQMSSYINLAKTIHLRLKQHSSVANYLNELPPRTQFDHINNSNCMIGMLRKFTGPKAI